MASDHRGPYGRPSIRDWYIGQELGRMQHQNLVGDHHGLSYLPQPHPHLPLPQPLDMEEMIHREIEKEKIRQEEIMSEILRRRELEAEVRRELMVVRESALQGRSNEYHYGSPSPTGLDLHTRLPLLVAEGRFLEERMMQYHRQTNNLSNRCESILPESLQFHRAYDDLRSVMTSEVVPVLERIQENEKISLQAKATENITGAAKAIETVSGSKRGLSGSDGNESEYRSLKKKLKGEWSCNLCQVSTSREQEAVAVSWRHCEGSSRTRWSRSG